MTHAQIAKCLHCGQRTSHEIIHSADGLEEIIEIDSEQGAELSFMSHYYLTRCKSCSEISLFSDWDGSDRVGDLDDAACLYPAAKRFTTNVPETVTRNYEEAKKVQSKSPIAFAVLIRKCLEYVCKDQKAKGRNLKAQIEYLAKQGVIPQTLSRASNALRYLGNVGAHASDEEVDWGEARIMDDFFGAIIEYVYIAPATLEELEKKLVKKKTTKT